MIEILGIVLFCRQVGRILRAKGQPWLAAQFGTVGLWFFGELIGFVVGAVVFPSTNGSINPMLYITGILGALAGGITAVQIAKSRPSVNEPLEHPRSMSIFSQDNDS